MTGAAGGRQPAGPQHRVVFDFEIGFSNGGELRGRAFRLDIEGSDIGDAELAGRLVHDLRLLMVDTVRISDKRVIVEPHKRVGEAGETCMHSVAPAATVA